MKFLLLFFSICKVRLRGLTLIRKVVFYFLTSGDVHFMDTLVSIMLFTIFVELIGLNSPFLFHIYVGLDLK